MLPSLPRSPSSISYHSQCPYHREKQNQHHHHHHHHPNTHSPLPPPLPPHHHHHHHHPNHYEEERGGYSEVVMPVHYHEQIDYNTDHLVAPPLPIQIPISKSFHSPDLEVTNGQQSSFSNNLDFSSCCCCCCLCCCLSDQTKQRCFNKCNKKLTDFTRCFLIIPNFLFLVFGCVMVVLGIWLRSEKDSYFYAIILNRIPVSSLLTYDKFPLLIIIVGSCILVLSFLGCCGACAESVCFLCLYTTFLILIVVMEISLGVIAYAMREQIQQRLDLTLQQQLSQHYNSSTEMPSLSSSSSTPPSSSVFEIFATKPPDNIVNQTLMSHITTAWNQMQNQLTCCGSIGPEDYIESLWLQTSSAFISLKVPPSCCSKIEEETDVSEWLKKFQVCQSEAEFYFENKKAWLSSPRPSAVLKTQGCGQKLKSLLETNIHILLVVVSAVIVLQIVDFVFACLLLRLFRKKMMELSWYGENQLE